MTKGGCKDAAPAAHARGAWVKKKGNDKTSARPSGDAWLLGTEAGPEEDVPGSHLAAETLIP